MRLHCPQPDKLPLKCLALRTGSRISCCASRTFACRVALNDRTHIAICNSQSLHTKGVLCSHYLQLNSTSQQAIPPCPWCPTALGRYTHTGRQGQSRKPVN